MLIPLKEAIARHDLKIRGIIHVGAHWGQELQDYRAHGINDIVFIEPCLEAFKILEAKVGQDPHIILFNCACADREVVGEMFVAHHNQGQSNSLLKPKKHLDYYPEIQFTTTETVSVIPLDNLHFHRRFYNLLMMDTQGAELLVLKGATMTLETIDYIYAEVNDQELYVDNAMVADLDAYLVDFRRVDTHWAGLHGWGDAIYVRKTLLKPEMP